MGSRGRKSSAELAVVSSAGVVQTRRPSPPSELTDEQAEEWRAVVNVHAADWLTRDRHSMLVALCRHVVAQRHVAQLVDHNMAAEDYDVGLHDKLLKMQERESRCILSACVRLGIAQTTTYEKKSDRRSVIDPPWKD